MSLQSPPTNQYGHQHQYQYQYTPSSSSSACSTSYFALSCNFRELAEECPEFRDAWMDSKRRGREGEGREHHLEHEHEHKNETAPRRCGEPASGEARKRKVADDNETCTSSNNSSTAIPVSAPASASPSFTSGAFASQITHAFNASLTRCLLNHHFRLKMPSLPAGRLCPPIPNRANYACWLKELLVRSNRDLYRFSNDAASGGANVPLAWQYSGIDVGTGVSAIYPLLLCTKLFAGSDGDDALFTTDTNQRSANKISNVDECKPSAGKWKFLATDIDPLAIQSARANVQANHLADAIHVVKVLNAGGSSSMSNGTPKGPLFAAMDEAKDQPSVWQPCHRHPLAEETADATIPKCLTKYPKFDFVMTNPPFYSTLREATAPRAGDKRSRTDMSTNEGVYTPAVQNTGVGGDDDDMDATIINNHTTTDDAEGGDVGFIAAIMQDSQFFRRHVTWYTSLVAKRSSLDAILHKLQTLDGVWGNRGQIRTVEFHQGNLDSGGRGGTNFDDDGRREEERNPRVRWGIGWTYERAVGRCGVCRVNGGLQSFDVWVDIGDDATVVSDAGDKSKRAIDEVLSRLMTYFEELRDYSLKCSQQMRGRGNHSLSGRDNDPERSCVTTVEERFFGCNSSSHLPSLDHEHDNNNLPYDGHFLIDAFVESSGKCNENGHVQAQVFLEIYSHTKRGNVIINKIRGSLIGEIGRTNRRWRRLLKRQQSATS